MKNRLFKFAVVFLMAFVIYAGFHLVERKKADAFLCPCIDFVAVGTALTTTLAGGIMNFIVQGATDLVSGVFTDLLGLGNNIQEDFQKLARMNRLSESKIKEFEGRGRESVFSDEIRVDIEQDKYDITAREFSAPSDQVCGNATGLMAKSSSDVGAGFINDIITREDQQRSFFSDSYEFGTYTANAGIVRHTRLLIDGIRDVCTNEEQKGRGAEFCAPDNLFYAKNGHLETTEMFANNTTTIPWIKQHRSARLTQELLKPIPPEPIAIDSNRSETQIAYLSHLQDQVEQGPARYYLNKNRADRTEMPTFFGGDCTMGMEYVKEVTTRAYGSTDNLDFDPVVECASKATIDTTVALQKTNASDMTEDVASTPGNEESADLAKKFQELAQLYQIYTETVSDGTRKAVQQLSAP